MSLASAILRIVTPAPGGGIDVDGGITAVGATLDPGGLDVENVSTIRDNLTVEGTLFAATIVPEPGGGITELTGAVIAGPGSGSVAAAIAADAVTTAKILDANVTAGKLAADAVTTAKILDANVTAGKLAADAVTTAKILDANVTLAKLANLANGSTIARLTAGTGVPEAVTLAQRLAQLFATGEATSVANSTTQANPITMSGASQDYEFGGNTLMGAADQVLKFQPNGVDTNVLGQTFGGDGSSPYSEGGGSGVAHVDIASTGTTATVTWVGRSYQRDAYRLIVIHAAILIGSARYSQTVVAKVSNATEWTSAQLIATGGAAGTGILTGSTFWMRRVFI